MHWKKYAILLPPFLIISVLLGIYLPVSKKHYAVIVALIFWAVYYIWVYREKRKLTKNNLFSKR